MEQIEKFYNECDIVVSRAGALTISELCIVGKPSILIPSPNVSENHQFYNAKYLLDRKAAIMIEEKKIDNEFLIHLQKLLASKEIRTQLSRGIQPNVHLAPLIKNCNRFWVCTVAGKKPGRRY